jgi:hypothetical protein
LTVHDYPAYRAEAEAVGADGFLGKADFGTELVPLIHRLFGWPDDDAPTARPDQPARLAPNAVRARESARAGAPSTRGPGPQEPA